MMAYPNDHRQGGSSPTQVTRNSAHLVEPWPDLQLPATLAARGPPMAMQAFPLAEREGEPIAADSPYPSSPPTP